MADVNSNININFNTADALAQLRRLQAGLSRFHQSLAEGNLAAANAQKGLNAQLVQAVNATGKFSVSQVKVASSTMAFTTALEKNKLSLREYYRYSMAAATANTKVLSKAFAQEREIINRARRDRVKSLQAQYIQMAKAQGGFIEAMRIMPKTLMMTNGRFTELGTRIQYAAQRQQMLNQLLKQGSTQLLNFGKNTQWAGRQLMVGLTVPLTMLGSYASKAFRDLEKATVKFTRVYGDAFTNQAQVDEAVKNIKHLANEYTKFGVSVVDTMDMAATAAAAGFQGTSLTKQVESATKLAVLGQVEQQQALETTISLQNAFGLSADQLAEKINFLNAVENQTVLSIEDLTIAIPKAAPVIKQLGGSVEDLAFFLTAMKEGGINASEGANAIKSGLASLINPTDKASKMLAGFGINIKGIVEANKGDIKGTVVGFARALDTLDPLNRARAIEQLFGKFQFARLSTLFQNVSKDGTQASRALDLAGASVEELAVLSEREMKKVEDAVGTKFQAAMEQFKQDIMPLGKAFLEAMTPIVKFFGSLFEKFNNLSEGTKKAITIIVGVIAGLGPVALMTFGLLANGLANLVKLFALMRGGVAKLNGQTSVLGAGFNYVTQEQIEQQAAGQALHNTHTRLIEVFNIEKTAAMQLASAYNSLSSQMRNMASQNPGLFVGGAAGARSAVSKLPPVKKYADGVISVPGPKGAGDVVPAMVSPGEAIIPAQTSEKYRGLITAMFQDKVPGFATGRLPWGNAHPTKQSGAVSIGMPKSFDKVSQSRMIADQIDKSTKASRFAKTPPTDFGTLLQPFSGRSFPIPGVGGVYRKPNGELVVVKPTMDEKTALAEVRANQIASEVHGLISPKSQIKTMLDPTDITGKRKIIVLESKYDPRIAAATGKFTEKDMIKQLVASTLRADKDLSQSNISGNVLADPGTAGVFSRASGFRDYEKVLPSMGEMGLINTLAVKGGAKKFFAQETSSLASNMTSKQYASKVVAEIDRVLPKLEKLVGKWDLNPVERQVYQNMIGRLKEGRKFDWEKVYASHVRAGGNVPGYVKGIGDDATQALTESQKAKFADATFKHMRRNKTSKAQVDRLVRSLNKDTANALKDLEKTNPTQYKKALELLKTSGVVPKADGSIDLKQSKIYRDFIKSDLIYKDGQYHTRKALVEKGQSQSTSGRSYEDIKRQILYRMNAIEKNGSFSNKGFTASQIQGDLTPTTQSGGWRSNIPKGTPLYKALEEAETAYKAKNAKDQTNDPLGKLRKYMMGDLGYTAKQTNALLRTELSHISKTGEAGLGPEKWKKGFAKFDLRLLNSYVNPGGKAGQPIQNPRLAKILSWNEKSGNALGLTTKQTQDFKNALRFINTGDHPVTEAQVKLVREAARAQIIADDYLQKYMAANGGKKPGGFPDLGSIKQAKAVSMLIDDRIGSSYYKGQMQVFDLRAGATGSTKVLANTDEYLGDLTKKTATKLTVANTQSKPMGAVAASGTGKDTRVVTETPTRRVMTRSQVGRAGFVMANRETGIKGDKFNVSGYTTKRGVSAGELLSKNQIRSIRQQLSDFEKGLRQQNKYNKEAINAAVDRKKKDLVTSAMDKKIALNKAAEAQKNSQTVKEQQKQAKQQARQVRQEKVGRFSGGASMALGTAGMGLMMSGHTGAGMALTGASAVAGMAPMFAGMSAAGGIATGVVAVGASLYLLNKHFENAAKKQAEFVNSVSATTEKMDAIGAITNKVGSARAMQEVRSKGTFNDYNDVNRAGTQFGDTFLQSEVGKSMAQGFVDNMKIFGAKEAAQDFGLQLATYISDGVLTSDQASSIAEQIGIQLGSRTYTTNIQAEVRGLIGPNGENLLNNPLQTRINIVAQTEKRSAILQNKLNTAYGKGYSGRTESAQLAAVGVNNLEIAQAQADATEWQYKKQIQLLEKQLEQTTNLEKQLEIKNKIAELEKNMIADTEKMNRLVADQYKKELDRFNKDIQQYDTGMLTGGKEDAYFDSLKSMVKDRFAGTEFATMATDALSRNAKLSDIDLFGNVKSGMKSQEAAQQLEVQLGFLMANGKLNPQQNNAMLELFAGNLDALSSTLTLGIERHGTDKTIEMMDFFTSFEDKEKANTLVTDIINKDPKQFDKIGKALAQLSVLDGHEINMEAYLKIVNADGLEKLANDLATIEAMPDVTTKEAILKYFEEGAGKGVAGMDKAGLEGLMSKWQNWDKLPDVAKKEAISKYKTIYETVFADEQARIDYAQRIAREKANAASQGGRSTYLYDYVYRTTYETLMKGDANQQAQNIAAAGSYTYVGENGQLITEIPPTGPQSGDGTKVNPYADLLKRLKEVRNAAINAAGGIKDLNKALAEGNVTSVANKYTGIEQQLQSKGYNQGFIDFLEGMDAKEQAKWMRTATEKFTKGKNKGLFKNPFDKTKALAKGTKAGDVVLSSNAKSMGKGFDALVSGEFNTQIQRQNQSLKYQEDAYKKLRAAGYDHLTAQKIISDEYLAQSISTKKITEEEIRKNAVLAKEVVAREKINGLIMRGRDAINEQNIFLKDTKTGVSKIQELLMFLKSNNIKFSESAIRSIIGDPETASALIQAMDDIRNNVKGASDAMNDLVAGVKALKDNSDITLAIKIATQTVSETVNMGAQAAQRINDTLLGVYSNLTPSQLAGVTTKNPRTKVTKNIGAQAIANVNERYASVGMTPPTISAEKSKGLDAFDTVRSVQKERQALGQRITLAQSNASAAQEAYNNIVDSIRQNDEALREKIDAIESKYKPEIDAQEKIIDEYEKKIEDQFTSKIDALNKESNMLSNDLALIDNMADEINKKYDAQVTALQTVNQLNQQIAESQKQQLDLADALSQGDIAAAARAAQEMRATSAANYQDTQMQGIEKARENALGALVGPESGKTRLEIEKEQFRISQEIYKLETSPTRLEFENKIKDAKAEIARLEGVIKTESEAAQLKHDEIDKKLQAQATSAKSIADSAANTVKDLQSQDTSLKSIEDYLTDIAKEAAALDESTGYTLQDYLDLIEKFPDLVKLAEDYKAAIAAGEVAAANMNTSWEGILASINAIPDTIDIKSVLDIVQNITKNITEYIKQVYVNATDTSDNGSKNTGTVTSCPAGSILVDGQCKPINAGVDLGGAKQAPGKAWISDGKGGWTKPPKPYGDYGWDDNRGWVKGYYGDTPPADTGNIGGTTDSAAEAKLRADARAATEAAAKAAAEAAAEAAAAAAAKAKEDLINRRTGFMWESSGGLIPMKYFANGGYSLGTDIVPAMLTPGEFVMSKYAVQTHGVDKMKAINNGQSVGDSVYNYSINVNVQSDANANDIANAVMNQIKRIDGQRIRGTRI